MRKLIPTLLALPLLFPSAAYPLGLGDIRLHSALNQRFSGEIDLLSVRQEEAESIKVSLGSYETFARLGIDRIAALNHLQFEVVQRPNGSYYVQVSSERPIREPFLDFLIEVNWSSGRMLREYTVLLDPPELMKEGAATVAAPTSAPSVRSPEPDTAPAAQAVSPSSPKQASVESSRAGQSDASAAAASEAPAAPVAATSQIRTHRVARGDTLSGIARGMRTGGATDEQVMMALLKANPEAFFDDNINRLKAGAVLRLDPALIGELTRAEAAREVAAQTRAWQDYKARAAEQAKARPASEPSREPGKAVAAPTESRLKLVAPEKGEPVDNGKAASSAPATAGAADIEQELALALEAAEAHRQQNVELQKRMAELEKQLADMQRLLTLKSDDLAALQRQLKGEPAPQVLPSEQAQQQSAQPAPAEQSGEPGSGNEPEAGAQSAKESEAVVPSDSQAQESTPAAAPEPAGSASPEAAAKPAAAEPAPKAARPVAVPPQPPKSMVEELLDSANGIIDELGLVAVGGAGVALLALILGVVLTLLRRRRQVTGFQESILTAGDTSSLLRARQAEGELSEEQSFFSDFAISGMGDIQADDSEVDPVTEAGLYIEFGKFQQAEDLLKEAMKHNPESAEVKATLLEVYHKTGNREAFELLAVDAQTMLTKAGLWGKVQAMGHELAPDNPVFGGASAASGAAAAAGAGAAAVAGAQVLDIGLDLDEFSGDSDESGAGNSENFTVDLGVDFSDLDDSAEPAETDSAGDSGLDFDLDDSSSAQEVTSGAEQAGDLDFDLGGLDIGVEAEDEPSVEEEGSGEILEFGGLDLDSDSGTETVEADEFGFGDLDLGDTESAGSDADSASGSALGDFDLGSETGSDSETGFDSGESEPDLGGLELGATTEASASSSDDLADFDFGEFDLGAVEDDNDSAAQGAGLGDSTELSGSGEFGGLELADSDGTAELGGLDLGGIGSDEFGEDDDLFGELDEIGTKLDLAKAYVDMGDADGARSILEEVLQDGDDAQKGQAQELMKQIA